ncbi:MAG: sugar-binding domain-containing protein, partial [Eggerthellaceae bacterium]
PMPERFDGRILVPFSPEAPLSGVSRQLKPDELLWYRRAFAKPDELAEEAGGRCLLHFEAVDCACACYVNGVLAGTHVGGYLPFSFDVTDALADDGNEIALCVHDPSDAGVQLRESSGSSAAASTPRRAASGRRWLGVVPARISR